MATLNAVILPAKVLKGGLHKVRISLAHNATTRYLPTSIMVNSVSEFKNGRVVKRADASILNTKLRGIIQKYQDMIDSIEYIDGMTCSEVIYILKNFKTTKNLTLGDIYKEYIETSDIKDSTKADYKIKWNKIKTHISESFLISNISRATIINFDTFLRKELNDSSRLMYMGFLSTLIKYAIKCGYVQYKIYPFNGYKWPAYEIGDTWLSVDEIKAIRDVSSDNPNIMLCRDIFMLSYYLGGINIVDLLNIDFNKNKDNIKYIRTKTNRRIKSNKYVEFSIPEEAKQIIKDRIGKNGLLKLSDFHRKNRMNAFFRIQLPKLKEAAGIKHRVVFYSARKSFSQHAFNLGISTGVIDYILGHKLGGGSIIYKYVYVTPEMATDAIRKVLDNLK